LIRLEFGPGAGVVALLKGKMHPAAKAIERTRMEAQIINGILIFLGI
jgi:hypothetical protein